MRRSSSSTTPMSTPRSRARSNPNSATWARPASAPTASTRRTAFTTRSSPSSPHAVGKLKVGDGTEAGVTQGPLINEEAVEKVEAHVADALKKGGQGDDRRQTPQARPHVLRADGAFGPRRLDADRAARRPSARSRRSSASRTRPTRSASPTTPNSASPPISTPATSAGCGASPRRSNTAWSAINTGAISSELAPFGGVKESGIGREGSRHGAEEFVELKYMLMGGLDR